MIYKDKDGKPKIIWKVTKDGAGVKNPKIYQYLNANGKDLPSDLFEFISQHDWDDKVKAAFRNGKDLQIGDKYNPVLGALVASGQYLEDGYKFMTEDELGQALQMLGFNFASYRLATNKGTKTVENKNGSGAKLTVETTTNSKIPTIHKPNTVINRVDENGNLISERIFDDKGRVIKDIHHTDHGNPKMHPKVPHEHIWDWSDPKKPRPSK